MSREITAERVRTMLERAEPDDNGMLPIAARRELDRSATEIAHAYLGAVRRAEKAEQELARAEAEATRLRAAHERVGAVLSANGCECECDHHYEDHDDDCERCLGCRIEAALGGPEQPAERPIALLDRAAPEPRVVVCSLCNDTHKVPTPEGDHGPFGDGTRMCTSCPAPCQKCRAGGTGAYCEHTPCSCACHEQRHPHTVARLIAAGWRRMREAPPVSASGIEVHDDDGEVG